MESTADRGHGRMELPPMDGARARTSRCDTPLLPPRRHAASGLLPSFMVLTGIRAGECVAVGTTEVLIGSAADADFVVEEPGVSRHHARVRGTAEGRLIIQDLESTNGSFIGSRRIRLSPLADRDQVRLGPHFRMRFAMLDAVEESLQRQLYESSVRDPLTRVFNRNYLSDRMVAEIAHARRAGGHAAVLMLDLDNMKQINDRFGHLAGDRALCLVASMLLRLIRVEDVLARFGGDEFVILARATGGGEVARLAERVRCSIETLPLSARGQSARMTASVGAASLAEVEPTDGPVAALLALADERMYQAKASGGNSQRST